MSLVPEPEQTTFKITRGDQRRGRGRGGRPMEQSIRGQAAAPQPQDEIEQKFEELKLEQEPTPRYEDKPEQIIKLIAWDFTPTPKINRQARKT